ncbi:MAG: TonB-dependent receptor [Saprospiraceae bacterium]|nr:TonB-dependent receptor [Saprospiraceae bacterium]
MKIQWVCLLMLSSCLVYGKTVVKDSINPQNMESVTIIGEKSKSIPGSGQYLGIKTLHKLNQPNINSVLRNVPGVSIRDEEGFGLRPNLGLRGTQVNRSARITLMEDGILIAPAPYADPSAYYFPTFFRMQGVEVLKGSSQIKYGPYTIGGAINLISTPIPSSFQGFAQVGYGSFRTNQQRIWVGDSRKNFDYLFEFSRYASHGFKQLGQGENTGFDRRDAMAKFRWHTDATAKVDQELTLKFTLCAEEANETYLGLTHNDYNANPYKRYAATKKDLLNLGHQNISIQHSIIPTNGFKIITTAYLTKTFRDWGRINSVEGVNVNSIVNDPAAFQYQYFVMTGQKNGQIDYQNAERVFDTQGVQSQFQYIFSAKNLFHKATLGVRYHQDKADRFATRSQYSMATGNMILNTAGVKGNQENQLRLAKSASCFFSYDLTINRLKFSPGIRFEHIRFHFQNFGTSDVERLGTFVQNASNMLNVLVPGMGIHYNVSKKMNLFCGIHKGFSPPGMPSTSSNTVQAREESSVNYELGFRIENQEFEAQFTGFLNQYNNILGSDNISGGGAGTGDQFNAGKARIAGIESSLQFQLLNDEETSRKFSIPVSLVYTYTSPIFRETFLNGGGDWGNGIIHQGDRIPFLTPHQFSANIGIEGRNFNITLSLRYVGNTRIKPGQSLMIFPSENSRPAEVNALKSFCIVDLSSNLRIHRNLTFFLTLQNFTNNLSIVSNLPQGYRAHMPISGNIGFKTYIL